jgi:folate-binding protein YgfZ
MQAYSVIEMRGPDSLSYAHRMWSRDFKHTPTGKGWLTLFLSAEGKIRSRFWALVVEGGIDLLIEESSARSLFELIEKFHFAENFTLSQPSPIHVAWRPLVGESIAEEGSLEGNSQRATGRWRQTEFQFSRSSAFESTPKSEVDWLAHRILVELPEMDLDYSEDTLIFDMGFEELCTPGKGCYVGQEVVERVRSRGGKGPRQLVSLLGADGKAIEVAAKVFDEESGKVVGAVTQSVLGAKALAVISRSASEALSVGEGATKQGCVRAKS